MEDTEFIYLDKKRTYNRNLQKQQQGHFFDQSDFMSENMVR